MPGVDVLIVTALKQEHDAARDVAINDRATGLTVEKWEQRGKGTETPYLFARATIAGGTGITIALARPTRMGATATAPLAASLTERLRPTCLAMCGVCAGNPSDVALGDVIVAEMVYAYDEGKKKRDAFEGDHRQIPMLESWVRISQDLEPEGLSSYGEPTSREAADWLLGLVYAGEDPKSHPAHSRYFPKQTWKSRVSALQKKGLITRRDLQIVLTEAGRAFVEERLFSGAGAPSRLPFLIKVGPMASGNVVAKDGRSWDKLRKWGVRSVLGLEMEAAMIGSIAHRLHVPGWVVVKGVMDHADPRKNDRFKSFASRASAEVLFHLLTRLPLESSARDRTPEDPGAKSPGSASAAPFSRLFQLPPKLSDFVGRDSELREVVDQLRAGAGRVGLSALRGMGGVGKTTLAVRVAHAVKDRYPDAQLFLDLQGVAERPVSTAEAMKQIIRDFHPEAPDLPETEPELLPIYRSTLAGKRALLLLDNAADAAQVKNLIAGDETGFLITSRKAMALDGVASVRIDVLSPGKSLEMLRGIVKVKGSDDELREVAELCGHLPLALRVAGDFLRLKDDWTVGQYIKALYRERLRWLKVEDDADKDVEAVLKLSSAQLARDNMELATRWHFLGDWPSDFAADAAAAAWNMDPDDHAVRQELSELVARSLVLFDEGTRRYKLHDLMKPIASGLFGNQAAPVQAASQPS